MLTKYYNKLKYPILVLVLLSLLVHVAVYTILNIAKQKKKPVIAKTVEVEYISPQPTKTTEGDRQKKAIKRKKQIVTQEKRINDEKPEDTKFLSKFDQRVKKQTRAAKSGEFRNTAKPGEQISGQNEKKVADKTPAKKKLEKGPGKIKKLSQLVPQYSLTPDARKDLARHVGDPSQRDDYLKDVETGLQTALSTREFLYYSYYDRIKNKIRQFWEPNVRQQVKMIYRKGRTIASSSDRITQVLITLDSQGTLERIEVITQSGVSALDDAAVQAFREAAPFPNPPKGMVEPDGRIRIRWDFILEARSLEIIGDKQHASLARAKNSL
jgi:TonB family protein